MTNVCTTCHNNRTTKANTEIQRLIEVKEANSHISDLGPYVDAKIEGIRWAMENL